MEERKDYLLRGIDAGLWKEFKAACAHYDISIRATFIKHIQNIVNDYRKDVRGLKSKKAYLHKKGDK